MSQILSRDELDALVKLVGPDAGATPPNASRRPRAAAKPHDFRRCSRLARGDTHALDHALGRAARALGPVLGRLLRLPVTVGPPSLTEASPRSLLESLPSPCFLYVLDVSPEAGRGLLVLEPAFAAVAIDRMLGGTGNAGPPRADVSRAEAALSRRLVEALLSALRDALREVAPLALSVERFETDPRLSRALPAGEPLVVCELKIAAGALAGRVRLALPERVIAPEPEGVPERARPESPSAAPRSLDPASALADVPVEAVAVLGETKLSVGALLGLEVGDVLRLERRAGEPVELKVAGQTKFLGHAARRGGRAVIRLTSR